MADQLTCKMCELPIVDREKVVTTLTSTEAGSMRQDAWHPECWSQYLAELKKTDHSN